MENSEVFRRVVEEKLGRKHRIVKIVSQCVVVCFMVIVVSLFLTAFIVVKWPVVSLMAMAILCVCLTVVVTVIGMILLTIWIEM